MAEKYESFDLSGTKIYVSEDHRFGTDAFLLADFADPAPHHKVCDLCFCKNTMYASLIHICKFYGCFFGAICTKHGSRTVSLRYIILVR